MTAPKYTSEKVAVKRMPCSWVMPSPKEFDEKYPKSTERPWFDICVLTRLTAASFSNSCKLYGAFTDGSETFVVMELATDGDFFTWCGNKTPFGREREAPMRPLLRQTFEAVRWLHDNSIAHRDISLENLLLTTGERGQVVKIIDFGMATTDPVGSGTYGKHSYQSPEMHVQPSYEVFLSDVFALGVVMYGMALQDYPWVSTRAGSCKCFDFVNTSGFRAFLAARKVRGKVNQTIAASLSPEFIELMAGLVAFKPKNRYTLGEHRYAGDALQTQRKSALDAEWLAKE
mmetsp:Transcript_26385/g.61451  ORF Transcript_26385/g.61451 Transcript_26385/m.61451 type:complete len:287 (+) Transcript_26385:64-924(+)